MIISIIAAMSDNRVIGCRNKIPWDVPADRRRFRDITMGHTLIMGRKTYESIGRPLPGRRTIVLSRNAGYVALGCTVCPDLAAALDCCKGEAEVFICGGGEVYRESLPLAVRIYLTVVHQVVEGDVFFPELGDDFMMLPESNLSGNTPASFLVFMRRGAAGACSMQSCSAF